MMLGRRELTVDCQNTTIQLMIFVHPKFCIYHLSQALS